MKNLIATVLLVASSMTFAQQKLTVPKHLNHELLSTI